MIEKSIFKDGANKNLTHPKFEKGITLIALVVTIIILLILAGVTINLVINNALIGKSQTAVDTYYEESEREKLILALTKYKMGKITGEGENLQDYLDEINGEIIEEDNTTYTIELDKYEFIVDKDSYEVTLIGLATGEKPILETIEVELSEDKKSAIIKVKASAIKGGTIKVTINEEEATLTDGTYNLEVTKNGTYKVIIEESGINRTARRSVEVEGIETIDKTQIITDGDNINGSANGTLTGLAYKYYNPVIPVGFKILETTDASWEDSDNDEKIDGWNEGLVIEDVEGNQFVWVPVDGTDVTYKKWCTRGIAYNKSGVSDGVLPTGIDGNEIDETNQIETYGGFYIARYEAGIPTTLTTALTTASAKYRNVSGVPVSQKNQIPWNYINHTKAKANAESMYTSNYVKSGLVTGTQWDTVLKWLLNSGVNVQSDSSEWGNYYHSKVTEVTQYSQNYGASWTSITSTTKGNPTFWLLKTGHSDYTSRKNIYDLAGNISEWNNEIYNSSANGIFRGGNYQDAGSGYTAAYRDDCEIITTFALLGFRVALFIQ